MFCSVKVSQYLFFSVTYSLIPRPHPLTKRSDLLNQVEFLRLAHSFAMLSPSNAQNILGQTRLKKILKLR